MRGAELDARRPAHEDSAREQKKSRTALQQPPVKKAVSRPAQAAACPAVAAAQAHARLQAHAEPCAAAVLAPARAPTQAAQAVKAEPVPRMQPQHRGALPAAQQQQGHAALYTKQHVRAASHVQQQGNAALQAQQQRDAALQAQQERQAARQLRQWSDATNPEHTTGAAEPPYAFFGAPQHPAHWWPAARAPQHPAQAFGPAAAAWPHAAPAGMQWPQYHYAAAPHAHCAQPHAWGMAPPHGPPAAWGHWQDTACGLHAMQQHAFAHCQAPDAKPPPRQPTRVAVKLDPVHDLVTPAAAAAPPAAPLEVVDLLTPTATRTHPEQIRGLEQQLSTLCVRLPCGGVAAGERQPVARHLFPDAAPGRVHALNGHDYVAGRRLGAARGAQRMGSLAEESPCMR